MGHIEVEISGKAVLIDQDDWDRVKHIKWRIYGTGYAINHTRRGGKTKNTMLHRLILGEIPDGLVVDHINRNKLDNRRSNLRLVTHTENCLNQSKRRESASRHKGVARRGDRWQVVIRIEGKLKWIGSYETEEEAAAVAAPYFDTPMRNPLGHGVTGPPEAYPLESTDTPTLARCSAWRELGVDTAITVA